MPGPTITSVSPQSGPPRTAVTITGAGFDAGSRVGCPALVPTTYVDANTLTAEIPAELHGPAGTSQQVAVFVQNADGATSTVVPFTVEFPAEMLQCWTTVEKVAGEVVGFQRNGAIKDKQVRTWIESCAQEIAAAMLRRGLSIDPATWAQANTAGMPSPVDVLEMVNRTGAASQLAAAIAANFVSGGGRWAVEQRLTSRYEDHLRALRKGEYDKLFLPGAATVEAGPLMSVGDIGEPAFRKDEVF